LIIGFSLRPEAIITCLIPQVALIMKEASTGPTSGRNDYIAPASHRADTVIMGLKAVMVRSM